MHNFNLYNKVVLTPPGVPAHELDTPIDCDALDMSKKTKMNTEKPNIDLNPNEEDFRFQVKFVNESNNENPEFATEGASGFDLRANLTESVVLKPLHRAIIPTGLFFELQNEEGEGFEIQVRPRSGLAAKNGVTVLNTPGTIDSDYRGEIKIILINLGQEDFTVNHGDRIAQGVLAFPMTKKEVRLVNSKTIDKNTERGAGGFGHTGIN
jgi:dUTP pyrophosphatase